MSHVCRLVLSLSKDSRTVSGPTTSSVPCSLILCSTVLRAAPATRYSPLATCLILLILKNPVNPRSICGYLWPLIFSPVKLRYAALLIFLVILADQAIKIWIKTTYPLGSVMNIFGLRWARLYFIENEGMAWGWTFGGDWGKMALTLFRLAAVIFGTWYLRHLAKGGYTRGFMICASLIYAGALGNLIDSLFYGLVFSESTYSQVAQLFPAGGGYGTFLHGKVVDMLYFPIIENARVPEWMPSFIGSDDGTGQRTFTFFSPIFNIADASISVGVLTLLFFQKKLLKRPHHDQPHPVTTSTTVSDQTQVM
jgi:signal peptidase II